MDAERKRAWTLGTLSKEGVISRKQRKGINAFTEGLGERIAIAKSRDRIIGHNDG